MPNIKGIFVNSNVGRLLSGSNSYKKSSVSLVVLLLVFSFDLGPIIAPIEPNILLPIGPSPSIFGTRKGLFITLLDGGCGGGD